MGRYRKSARIQRWRGAHYLFYTDFSIQPPVDRRLSCTSLGAHDKEERDALLERYRNDELNIRVEANRRGGFLGYDTLLADAIDDYLAENQQRVGVRNANPEARAGLAPKSEKHFRESLTRFKSWLTSERLHSVTCGKFEPKHIRKYRDCLASTQTKRGNRDVYRSPATLNYHAVALKTAINWIHSLRPPRFPDIEALRRALKPQPVRRRDEVALPPDALSRFLIQAIEHDDPDRRLIVRRERFGRIEEFRQKKAGVSATPVARLFVLLALTGARLSEILNLTWDCIDFSKNRIRISAQKTGMARVLPLVNAPEGQISRYLSVLLAEWKLQAGERKYVLPYDPERTPAPEFPKGSWERVGRNAKLPKLGPQMLRRCFTSYCASLGVPPAVAALWQGHSARIAEEHYRSQVLERGAGSIEEAMGLTGALRSMLGRREPRMVAE